MKVSKDYLNFQPCTLEGAEANKWRWFEGDGGWKRSALNAAAAVLSTSFNVNVTSDNVKNRIKLWKSWLNRFDSRCFKIGMI
ncbi:hypothetical protein JHK85_012548 [Glycine max]|nr:hypothetical protein JHK85_012548 [Glycine max]